MLGVKVWTRYTAPSPSPYPTTHPEKEAANFFPPYIISHTAIRPPLRPRFVVSITQQKHVVFVYNI